MRSRFTMILVGLLIISTVSTVLALESSDPYIIFDDYFSYGWTNSWGWGITQQISNVPIGVNCVNFTIPATSQYEAVDFAILNTNASDYYYFTFWLYSDASGESIQVRLQDTLNTDFFYATIVLSWEGWEPISYSDWENTMTTNGSPDSSDIDYISFMMSSNNAGAVTISIDYGIFSSDLEIEPTPTPSPTPEFYQWSDELLFGDFAFIGILIFIGLGSYLISKSKYAGIFVFIIAMLYEIMLYDRLDIYGNNIYYMLILLVYAIFSAWSVFGASGE